MKEISGKELISLLALTLVAAWLRFHNLDQWPLFGDEVNTLVESRDFMFSSGHTEVSRWTVLTNCLSHLLIWISYNSLGESLFSARLVPALFGVLTIPVFYFLIRIAFTARLAFLTVLFITFSPNHIFLSTYARYNALLFFFGGTSFLLLLMGLVKRRQSFILLGFLLFLAAFLSHATAVMIFGVFFIIALFYAIMDKANRRNHLLLSAVLAAPFLILAVVFRKDLLWVGQVILTDFSEPGRGFYSPWRLIGSISYNNGMILSVFAILATFKAFIHPKREAQAVVFYWVVPFMVIGIASHWMMMGPRYLTSVLPGFYLLAALGVDDWMASLKAPFRFRKAFMVFFIIASQIPLLASNWSDGGRYDTLSAARFLDRCYEKEPHELILAESHMTYNFLLDHKQVVRELPYSLRDLLKELEGVDHALIVFPLQRKEPLGFEGKDYMIWLERNCKLLHTFSSKRYDFMRYEIVIYRYKRDLRRPQGEV